MARKPTHDELVDRFKLKCQSIYEWNPGTDLVYVREEKCIYKLQNGIWEPLDEEHISKVIYNFLKEQKKDPDDPIPREFDITNALVLSLVKELKLDLDFTAAIETTASPYVAIQDPKTYIDTNTWDIIPEPQPRVHRAFYRLPLNLEEYQNPQEPSIFLQFLHKTLVHKDQTTDHELVNFIQEVMGYMLLDTTRAEATFFFNGDGLNGKSTLLNVIEKMVGPAAISGMTLENLSMNRFATSTLVGKRLNTVKEESSERVKIDLFKTLVTGEAIGGERKFGSTFVFTPRVKFIFATNKIPSFSNVDKALRRRLFVVPFNLKLTDKTKIVGLGDMLNAEIPQITRWAIEGAKRLQKRGYYFERPAAVIAAGQTFDAEQSSVIAFFEENFERCLDMGAGFAYADLYGAYKLWCFHETKKPKTKANFITDLRARDADDERFPENRFWLACKNKQVQGVRGYKRTDNMDAWINRNQETLEVSCL